MKKVSLTLSLFGTVLIAAAQNVGIGITNPTQKLDVNGTIKTTGLQMPTGAVAGKILKTDADGVASWGSIEGAGLFNPPPAVELTCPAVAGSIGTGSNPFSVAVAGNYAYVVNSPSNTMQVINITNPVLPVVIGFVGTGNSPKSIAVNGNYAYVVNSSSNNMQVINISDPTVPTVVGSVGTGLGPRSVAIAGNYAYVVNANSNNMEVISITNPAAPVVVGSVATGNEPNSVAVVGNYAYVVSIIGNAMQVFNITNPAVPTIVGSIATFSSFPQSVVVVGNFAYVVSGGYLEVFNIGNPAAPSLVGLAVTTIGGFAISVAVVGNYAYVVNYSSNNMQVFNVSNPQNIVLEGSISTGNQPNSVAVVGNYAYVVNLLSNTMQVINLACSKNFTTAYNPATGQTSAIQLQWNTSGNSISNNNSGNVGVGTTSPVAKLDVAGSIRSSTTLTAGGLSTAGIVTNMASGLLGTIATVTVGNGGTGTSTAFTTGSIPFAGASGVYTQNNANLFWNNANARLGIGTAAPATRLDVAGSNNWDLTNTEGDFRVGNGTYRIKMGIALNGGGVGAATIRSAGGIERLNLGAANTNLLTLNGASGNVGIGTETPSQKLQVIGNILASGTITPSDARFKKNIHLITDPVQKIMQLNGVTYYYRNDEFTQLGFTDKEQVGVIAQEVERVLPQLVFADDKGYKAVDYSKLIPLLIEGIKDQQKQIDEQKAEIEKQKIATEKQKAGYEARLKAIEEKIRTPPAADLTSKNE